MYIYKYIHILKVAQFFTYFYKCNLMYSILVTIDS